MASLSELTTPESPKENGVIVRRNRILMDMVVLSMSKVELPNSIWDYARCFAINKH